MEDSKKIVEINGVKIEVDLREAQTVDTFKVGDKVKVLIKSYGDSYKSYPGMIIGFDQFKALPTIIIAYIDAAYSSADIKFVYINSETKDAEICLADRLDLPVSEASVMDLFNREIEANRQKVFELEQKRDYFKQNFNKYFSDSVETAEDDEVLAF